MDVWQQTKHGVVYYKIIGPDDEVQQQIDLLFEVYPFEDFQTYVSHDEMKGSTRVVEIEHNQFRCS